MKLSEKQGIQFCEGLFPSCVHSRIRDKLPHAAIMINIKITPPEHENLPHTGYKLFS